jgi:hypothetical protein
MDVQTVTTLKLARFNDSIRCVRFPCGVLADHFADVGFGDSPRYAVYLCAEHAAELLRLSSER